MPEQLLKRKRMTYRAWKQSISLTDQSLFFHFKFSNIHFWKSQLSG